MLDEKTQEATALQILREMTADAVAECQDIELLDLVWKLLVISREEAAA